VFALTGPAIKLYFKFMWDVWIPDLVVQVLSLFLCFDALGSSSDSVACVHEKTETQVLAKEQAQLINGSNTLQFFDNWANQTRLISPEWTYMQVSLNASAPRYVVSFLLLPRQIITPD
jgi:hypothetical protein